jgi:hypothetical protein
MSSANAAPEEEMVAMVAANNAAFFATVLLLFFETTFFAVFCFCVRRSERERERRSEYLCKTLNSYLAPLLPETAGGYHHTPLYFVERRE